MRPLTIGHWMHDDITHLVIGLNVIRYSNLGLTAWHFELLAARSHVDRLCQQMERDGTSAIEEPVYLRLFDALAFLTYALRGKRVNDHFLRAAIDTLNDLVELTQKQTA